MDINHMENNIAKVKKIISLLKELDLTEKRKTTILTFYPKFIFPKRKEEIFANLRENIVSRLKYRTTYKDHNEIMENIFKFQMAYIDAK